MFADKHNHINGIENFWNQSTPSSPLQLLACCKPQQNTAKMVVQVKTKPFSILAPI